jgi:hypothetical protein
MMNIKKYMPKHINLEEEKAKAPTYAGTFTELYELVKSEKVTLVTQNDGQVIGIYVESGAGNMMLDDLAGRNFQSAYGSKPMMQWVEILVDAVHKGKEVTEINEDEGTCLIAGEVVTFSEKHSDHSTSHTDLPTEVVIDVEYDLDGEVSEKTIANYLRNEYDHYLSGTAGRQFTVKYEEGDEEVTVSNIQWGRKR